MAVLEDTRKPTEGIRHEQPNTTLYIKTNNVGQGTLYITESFVTWLSSNDKGITLPYPNIILHAISRDTSRFPNECLYVHTDCEIAGFTSDDSGEDDEMLDACPPVTELYFVPEDKDSLYPLFQAMAACQALHPDPQDEFSPDEDFEGFDDYEMNDAHSQLANLEISSNGSNGHVHDDEDEMNPECFEDAEDENPEH